MARFYLGWSQVRSERFAEGLTLLRDAVAELRASGTRIVPAFPVAPGAWFIEGFDTAAFTHASALLQELR